MTSVRARPWLLSVVAIALGAAASDLGCSHAAPAPAPGPTLTTEQLRDPATCGGCHEPHYREWAGSMHAYAADDPLFRAMNARGQRETGGALGSFCVQCHAPLAVRAGATRDGLNLDAVDPSLKGITCYYCHSIDDVTGAHNAPLHLATDGVLRASIADPIANPAHRAGYSPWHDGGRAEAAKMCGSCHDVQNDHGVDLARTYAEWQTTIFARADPKLRLSCPSCHMAGRDAPAATVAGAPLRRVHDHTRAGVDVALTPFAQTDAQRKAVQASLDPSLVTKLCVKLAAGETVAEVTLDDAFAGHSWPSGAAYHRRAWLEVAAFADDGTEIYRTGAVPDDRSVASVAATDKDLFHLGDQMFDAAGEPAEMLWEATRIDSALLLPAVTTDPADPAYYHAVIKSFSIPRTKKVVRVTSAVHIRPVDFDFVDDLIGSGDLDPALRAKVTTFTLAGSEREWTLDGVGLFHCMPGP
ncbi:MAG: hypothetical protein NVSMB47_11280 [Polyangiales bacterium]